MRACMCVRVCVHECVYVRVCAHMCACVCACAHVCVRVRSLPVLGFKPGVSTDGHMAVSQIQFRGSRGVTSFQHHQKDSSALVDPRVAWACAPISPIIRDITVRTWDIFVLLNACCHTRWGKSFRMTSVTFSTAGVMGPESVNGRGHLCLDLVCPRLKHPLMSIGESRSPHSLLTALKVAQRSRSPVSPKDEMR